MAKGIGKVSGLFVLLTLLALIVFMPGRFVLQYLPVQGLNITQAYITGPWWRANLQYTHYLGLPVEKLSLTWVPKIFAGQWLSFNTVMKSPFISAQGQMYIPMFDSGMEFTDLSVEINLSHMPIELIPVQDLPKISGRMHGKIPALVFLEQQQKGFPPNIAMPQGANIDVDILAMAFADNVGNLTMTPLLLDGKLELASTETAEGAEEMFVLNINFPNPPMQMDGSLTLQGASWGSNLRVQPSADIPAQLTGLLSLVATDQQGADYLLQREGGL
jgi:hypothetical protein